MKISVIIPCYNVEKYIAKCVRSILNTKFTNFELILINDGSSDKTLAILNDLRTENINIDINIIDQKNFGVSATRNLGIEVSNGDYIMFVDSDDWVENNYFEYFINHIDDDIDLIMSSYSRETSKGFNDRILNLNGIYKSETIKRRTIGLLGSELADPSQADSIVSSCGKLYKKSIIRDNQIEFVSTKDIGSGEDLLFNLRYLNSLKSNSQTYCLELPLYKYFKNNNESITTVYKENLFEKWQLLFVNIKSEVRNEDESIAFNNRICLSIIGLSLNEVSNPNGFLHAIKELKKYLNHKDYIKAYKMLEFKYFPIHWKVFFFFAKNKQTFPLLILAKIIHKIINKS